MPGHLDLGPTRRPDLPNVLLITVDHWTADLLRVAGHPAIKTPTLDRLARDGIRFTQFYSSCPVCIPARRSLMTGTTPRMHGDRVYLDRLPMPDLPTLAECFSQAGYQTWAAGKLHVYPQRNRIGFDDVVLLEEGRYQFGVVDDYQIWLGEQGLVGREFDHGLSNNSYETRPWHLPEEAHGTVWTTNQMIRLIQRLDPTRPALLYLSYAYPHPPLVPLASYLDLYRDVEIPEPVWGDWSRDAAAAARDGAAPAADTALQLLGRAAAGYSDDDIRQARRAFYAQCTLIDHQLRRVIGSLREHGWLDNTIIAFTADHGDMLFDHGMVAKRSFYQNAAHIPLILSGPMLARLAPGIGETSDRLGCLEDLMPTLLDLCELPIPDSVEGISLFSAEPRALVYGEISDDLCATRMVTDGRHKLIYYPCGNRLQLFDVVADPRDERDLFAAATAGAAAGDMALGSVLRRLTQELMDALYGDDRDWIRGGELVGFQAPVALPADRNYGLSGQRGGHWPPPPPQNG
ncbi:MAG: sulfatase-like hydrolase/transferase [Bacillota bacterium]|nr:sulfatase-like hydrolase/transferase [Bacillota bacterium]